MDTNLLVSLLDVANGAAAAQGDLRLFALLALFTLWFMIGFSMWRK